VSLLHCDVLIVICVSHLREPQMPLSNRIVVACMDRSVSFYDMLTGMRTYFQCYYYNHCCPNAGTAACTIAITTKSSIEAACFMHMQHDNVHTCTCTRLRSQSALVARFAHCQVLSSTLTHRKLCAALLLSGEMSSQILGLKTAPTCLECVQQGPETQVQHDCLL
jgi:hypothetical protein